MRCPLASWKPVGNHGGPIRAVFGLVLHVQQGNGSLFGYFNNPTSQVSSHFWVSKGGSLEQYVDTDQIAWAQAAGNLDYLSVETEGFATEGLTASQVKTLAELLLWCSAHYEIPLVGPVAHGERGFTPHCNPDGTPDPAWGNHICPGGLRLAEMRSILSVANSLVTAQPAKIGGNMIAATKTGAGYYVARSDGSVYAYGDAHYSGGINNAGPSGSSVMVPGDECDGIAVCPTGGYWLSTAAGHVYAFGGAPYFGGA